MRYLTIISVSAFLFAATPILAADDQQTDQSMKDQSTTEQTKTTTGQTTEDQTVDESMMKSDEQTDTKNSEESNSSVKEVSIAQVQTMPKGSNVVLSGVVDSVGGDKEFKLGDTKSGKAIDVLTKDEVSVAEGQQIKVKGTVDDSFLFGKRIVSAEIFQH